MKNFSRLITNMLSLIEYSSYYCDLSSQTLIDSSDKLKKCTQYLTSPAILNQEQYSFQYVFIKFNYVILSVYYLM